jgi:hypothetical protein
MWTIISYLAWGVSAALGVWMLFDWIQTDSRYSEEQLTSSREGEIEALAEKHELGGSR